MSVNDWSNWNFSFSAAGWLKMYQFGVAKAIQQYGAGKTGRFAGSSAGSLVATALVLECDFDDIKNFALKCVDDAHKSIFNAFALRRYVEQCMECHLTQDSHKRLNDRLEVCVTTLPWCRGIRYMEFDSKQDLKQSLLASCCMTPLAGFPFKYKGNWVFDGGLSAFQPIVRRQPIKENVDPFFSLSECTITVSPFYCSRSDIKPTKYVPMWWALYPPSVQDMEELFQLGYRDCVQFLQKRAELSKCVVEIEEITTTEEPVIDESRKSILDFSDIQYLEPSINNLSSTLSLNMHNQTSTKSNGLMSLVLDLLLLIFIFFFVKPVAFGLLYTELYIKSIVYISYANLLAILHYLPYWEHQDSEDHNNHHNLFWILNNKRPSHAYKKSLDLFMSAINFKLFLRAWIGPRISINEEKLFNQSFIYRLLFFVL